MTGMEATKKGEGKFNFGAVYIIEQDYTDEEIQRDLQCMKEAGFNLITLWPVSNPWLAQTSTEHVFTKTREVMDECARLGMKVILQLFGQNPSQEFMCDSLLTDDMMIHDEEGEHVNYNEYWMNMNHPRVRELVENYFEKVILELKDHPALYGWDVFNEAHFRSDDPYTVGKYQQWLKEKYKDIQKLNYRWYRRYETFTQVNPKKRRSTYSVWSSLLPSIEYERFRSENLTEICSFLYETAHKYDAEHPIIIDGTSSQILFESVIARNNDEFDTAHVPDIYGGTFYPKSWGRNYKEKPWMAALYFKIPASAAHQAGKPYFVNELQTHTQSVLTPCSDVTPQELENWTWMSIFTGAQGLQLWRWRPFLHGYQSTGRGVTQMDGTPNARGEVLKKVTGLLEKNSDFFASGEIEIAKPVVRIGLSYRSRLIFDAFTKWQKNIWPGAVAGWHHAFWNFGVPIEFTDLDNLSEEEMHTPVLILPSIVSLSEKTVKWLEEYVQEGGMLIADGRTGAVDEWATVPPEGIPGEILSKVFGVRELDVFTEGSYTIGETLLEGNFQCQHLEAASGTEVLSCMEDGKPAIVANRYGKGRTLYIASFLGADMEEKVPQAVWEILRKNLTEQCPEMIYTEKSDQVHIAFLENKGRKVMLAVNFSSMDQCVKFCNVKYLCLVDLENDIDMEYRGDFAFTVSKGVHLYEWQERESWNS